jgi:hypothetical protein
MKQHPSSSGQPWARHAAAALALVLLLAAPAAASAESFTVGVSVPVVMPLGYTTHGGAGATPSFGWNFGPSLNLAVTSGFVYYHEGDHDERTVPVLVGASWIFHGLRSALPYVALRTGYTYAFNSERSPHWLTVMGGGGVLIPTRHDLAVDVGFDVLVADVRGNSRDPVGLLVKVGVLYGAR